MMRVARFANFVAATSGGIRSVMRRLSIAAAPGVESHVVVPGPDPGIEDIPGVLRVHARSGVRLHPRQPYRLILSKGAIGELLDEIRPDVIEIHDQLTLAWLGSEARRRGIPSVLVAHERLDELARFWSRVRASRRAAMSWVARVGARVDRVVAPSRFAAAPYLLSGVPVTIVPWGVDHRTFTPGRVHSPGEVLRIVHCGRLSAEKDPLLSARATQELRTRGVDARVTIVGSGPVASKFASFDEAAVRMLGFVDGPAMLARVLQDADVFFAPGPFETFGVSALEAMACGLPVVCRESGAISEIPGTRSADGRPGAFADAALDLWGDRDARETAHIFAAGYTWERSAAALGEVYAA